MAERDEVRRRQAEQIEALEHGVFEHLYQSLVKWLGRVLERVLTPFRMFHVKPDPTAVWALTGEWQKIADHIAYDHLAAVADSGGSDTSHGRDRVSGNSFVQAQLARTHNLLMRVPDDVYNLVFAEISDGVNAGESNREISERVEKVLSDTGSETWRNRAMTIARTETIRAYNAGAMGSGLRAQELEQAPMIKEWLSTEDSRTRLEHREADGQKRLLLEPFQVGDSLLMFPADPLGDPDQVIQCRCTMLIKEAR